VASPELRNGMLPVIPPGVPREIPEPTLGNFLDGLAVLWPKLNTGNSSFRLSGSMFLLMMLTIDEADDVVKFLRSRGWDNHAIHKSAVFTATF